MTQQTHRRLCVSLLLAAIACAAPGDALAHTGHSETASLWRGAMHPLTGLDHILAMAFIGAVAALSGGRARWGVPLAFLAMMLAGAAAAGVMHPLPFVEAGVTASVLIAGAMLFARLRPPMAMTTALIGAFGALHGYAHGAEMAPNIDSTLYAIGFLATSMALLAAGFGAAVLVQRVRQAEGAAS